MPEGNIYLLTEKQRAYFQKTRAAIFTELHKEGIDTDTGFSVNEETLQRIAQKLPEKPAKINALAAYKKAHKALAERSFMIMRAGLQSATLEDFAHLYRLGTGTLTAEETETPEEHVAFLDELRGQIEKTRLFFYQGEQTPQNFRALYREWFTILSDDPSPSQDLSPIWPGSPAYQILSTLDDWEPPRTTTGEIGILSKSKIKITEYRPQWSFEPSPDQLDELRKALGLSNYRFVNLSDHMGLVFLDSFLKAVVDVQEKFTATQEQQASDTLKVFALPTENLLLPVDKINNNIWRLISQAKDNGQIGVSLEADTSRKSSKKEAIILAGITFDEADGMKITRQLEAYDKRVYLAVSGLLNGGNEIFSASQIYRAMGNEGQPSSADVQRINASLDKMAAARLYIDSSKEVEVNKGYKTFKYDASLLPFERVSAYIDNTLCEIAVHPFREPPLMSFAKERKQVTVIPRKLLASPLSKTSTNLTIEDYLLERIGRMKSPKSNANRKILFKTLYEKCKITTTKQKQRTPEKIRKYLDWYKKNSWIKDYKEDKDGFLITV